MVDELGRKVVVDEGGRRGGAAEGRERRARGGEGGGEEGALRDRENGREEGQGGGERGGCAGRGRRWISTWGEELEQQESPLSYLTLPMSMAAGRGELDPKEI